MQQDRHKKFAMVAEDMKMFREKSEFLLFCSLDRKAIMNFSQIKNEKKTLSHWQTVTFTSTYWIES